MIGIPLVIADFELDMPGIEPGPLGWYTSALTTGLHEARPCYFLHHMSGSMSCKYLCHLELYTTYKTVLHY